MAENKRYYWLKLSETFFEEDTMAYIESRPNGIAYSNFYLKLCLRSLRDNGTLTRFVGEVVIPYDYPSLARLTGVPVDVVKTAMEIFEKMGLVKKLETGELYISQINEMIGSETDKAKFMRRKRREELVQSNNVTETLPKSYSRDKSIEIRDKDINKTRNTRFIKPTIEEVKEYSKSKNLNLDAEDFWNYYESKGWVVGKTPMKNWHSAASRWARNQKEFKNTSSSQKKYVSKDYDPEANNWDAETIKF